MLGLLGEGGVARVYEVEHDDGRRAALKHLARPHPDALARLRREAEALQSLVHPNIVRFVDWIDGPDGTALVLEAVVGPRLADAAADRSLAEVEAWFSQILDGVAHAHDAGWLHRDLKPSNILLEAGSEGMVPKVADFGLAYLASPDTRLTASGILMGTPAYMAPEQAARPRDVDVRADVFSLGALLFELVCGRPPFASPDVFALLAQAQRGEFPDPQRLRPDLPDRVANAIRGALQPEPERRLESVEALRDVLAGTRAWSGPSQHLPPTEVERPPRPRPWAWGLAGVALLGVVSALALQPSATAEPPRIADAAAQARFEQALASWADVDFGAGRDLRDALRSELPDEAWVHTLDGLVLGAERRSAASRRAFERARGAVTDAQPVLATLLDAFVADPEGWQDARWTGLADDHPRDAFVQGVVCAQLGWGPDAERACERAHRLGAPPVVWWTQARTALRRPALADAVVYTEAFTAMRPDHPRGHALRGALHALVGEWPEAQAAAERALVGDPVLVDAHRLWAASRAHQGARAEAHARYAQLAEAPFYERVQTALALARTELGLGYTSHAEAVVARTWQAVVEAERGDLAELLAVADARLRWVSSDAAGLDRAVERLWSLPETPSRRAAAAL
ncbi:MAG: serine/threonine-protein kinase, partial [Bacteroidota bacterium]